MKDAMKWEPEHRARMLELIWSHRNSIVPFGRKFTSSLISLEVRGRMVLIGDLSALEPSARTRVVCRSREKLAENYRSSRLPRAVGNRRVAVTKICNPGGRPGPGGRNRRTYARLEPKGHPLPADKRKGTSGPNPGARSGNKWIGEPWGKTLAAKHGDKAMSLRGTFEPNAASDPGAIVALRIGGFGLRGRQSTFVGRRKELMVIGLTDALEQFFWRAASPSAASPSAASPSAALP
ncbi:hypothetical protein VOLCADRAFT_106413 [Volvox carteri f. nagariensis]|uniref:Uncharacterized protein n=1 Tax=Volvox carteri f. nagariensis TaxID=3068 RepID=D8U768_VOLCA|nr:uncharacterized protein VOLCADRAFT_106413 [Volvox carteri f. nagariensis]EFJ44430.1 hypothetical protein VOLCADRAFT_106413 [Volvox carteri f. nagariensis]|eukprot:XP_002954537.1 hypothetical protein VOLCADRAFT_106413 [Volvox carteri f. nagariensis]